MKFEHADGERAASAISLGPVRDTVKVEAGTFEVDDNRDDFDDVVERLIEAGHTPISADTGTDGQDGDGDEAEAEAEVPPASAYSETELVEMDYRELQSIATQYDEINGNASSDELTEALIKQRREEVEVEE